MDQRLKKHISQEHNYTQDLKVEDNGRESESAVVDMNMVKADASDGLTKWYSIVKRGRYAK